MAKWGLLLLLATWVGALPASAVEVPLRPIQPIIIEDMPGGMPSTYYQFFQAIAASGVPVRLRGMCISACTLILTLPKDQVCVEPTGSLGFHMATYGDQPDENLTEALVHRYYPVAIQDWIKQKPLVPAPRYLTAEGIIALGVFPACDSI